MEKKQKLKGFVNGKLKILPTKNPFAKIGTGNEQ
jgi:hypothetical protein